MRVAGTVLLLLGLVLFFWTGSEAGEKGKEVTLKGKITCPKCDLGTAKKCATVIVVKEKDKDVVYHFDDAGHGKYHKDICTTPKKGSVVGVVGGDEKKRTITVKSVTYE